MCTQAKQAKKEQRIRLRREGTPVKLDATVISVSPDGKSFEVEFDAPIRTKWLYSFGDSTLLSDMEGRDGEPVDDTRMAVKSTSWHVL